MCETCGKLFFISLVILVTLSHPVCSKYCKKFFREENRPNFSLLRDFACALANDELKKNPGMRTIALVELENNFPPSFSREVLKCLPSDVAKVNINPHSNIFEKNTMTLPKESMIIYVADEVDWRQTFFQRFFYFNKNFPIVHHLSKHLIISSDKAKAQKTSKIFTKLLNVVQIYEENRKVVAKSFDTTRKLTTYELFETSQQKNLSQILFPDKAKNLNGNKLQAVFNNGPDAHLMNHRSDRPNCKWTHYVDIIADKLNATAKFIKIEIDRESSQGYHQSRRRLMTHLIHAGRLDFYLNYDGHKFDLESYNVIDWCFLVPLPRPFSIIESILFLPLDKSCWKLLGISVAICTLIWRIAEGHWDFVFGIFAFFVRQAQLVDRIPTSRLNLKVLRQIFIFTIFVFSYGYQSLVTSFMLNPIQAYYLESVDQLLDSNLLIYLDRSFDMQNQNNPKYQRAKYDGRVVHVEMRGDWPQTLVQYSLAFAQPCKTMKHRIENQGDGRSWRGLYLIPEVILSQPEDLYTPPLHPYIDKFQEIMDWSFAAGLPKQWEKIFFDNFKSLNSFSYGRMMRWEEAQILDFGLIAPFFNILFIGFLLALVALILEFLVHYVSKKCLNQKRNLYLVRNVEAS